MRFFAKRAIVAALLLAATAGRAQTTGQIRGRVVDDDGNALAGVRVEATASSSGSRSAGTGKDGQYRFSLLSPGTYKVTFTLESYSQVEKMANVRLDGTVTVNAKLFRLSG